MEELKKELEKLSKAYVDIPENEEKILIPFVKRLLELPMKERRKLLPVIRDLQWIKSKFAGFSSETTCIGKRYTHRKYPCHRLPVFEPACSLEFFHSRPDGKV